MLVCLANFKKVGFENHDDFEKIKKENKKNLKEYFAKCDAELQNLI